MSFRFPVILFVAHLDVNFISGYSLPPVLWYLQLWMFLHSIFSESMGFRDLKGSGALKSPFSHPTRWTFLAAIVKRSGAVNRDSSEVFICLTCPPSVHGRACRFWQGRLLDHSGKAY